MAAFGFTAQLRRRGEAAQARRREAGFRARRWVVEWTPRGMNRFRRLRVRWEKKPMNDRAFLHFACAWIAFRASGLFGEALSVSDRCNNSILYKCVTWKLVQQTGGLWRICRGLCLAAGCYLPILITRN